jgi:O-antigen/teichoic acid export membrane protein
VAVEEAVEEVTPGPLRSLGRHTLVYGSGYVASAAVGLLLVPVYTHTFTPGEFGLLALMLVLYGVGKQVYDLGFTNSVARFYFDTGRDDHSSLRDMRATSLAFLAAYAGALTAALCVFAGTWSNLLTQSPRHADLIRIVAITLFADTLAIVPLTLIRMQERSGLFVAITIVRLVTSLGLSILLVVVLDQGVSGALLASAIPAVGITAALLLAHPMDLRGDVSRGLLRQMLAFGLPFVPVLLCGWVIDASDRYLLEIFRTRDEVGFYSLAYRFAQVMQIAVAAFSMGWAPLRYRIYEQPGAQAVYRRLTNGYVLVATLLGVALALLADEIVAIIAPPSYAPAASVVPYLVLAYGLQGLYYLMVTGMGVVKRTGPMAWIALAGAAVNVGVNLVAIPEFGMKGAALTTLLAYLVLVGGSWYASQRVYPIPYDWPLIGKTIALAIITVVVAHPLTPSGIVVGTAYAAAAWVAFVVLLIATRTVSREDVDLARNTVRGWLRR